MLTFMQTDLKKISGEVPLMNTLAMILRLGVCGQMCVLLQTLSGCWERTHIFKSAICLQLFAGQGFSKEFWEADEWQKSTKPPILTGNCIPEMKSGSFETQKLLYYLRNCLNIFNFPFPSFKHLHFSVLLSPTLSPAVRTWILPSALPGKPHLQPIRHQPGKGLD